MTKAKKTIGIVQLVQMFPNQEVARKYLEGKRWKNGVCCPLCDSGERITVLKGKNLGCYRCNSCKEDFTVRTKTIMERSHIPLHKWMYAIYLLMTERKGVSSLQLSKQLDITQKSAWFMEHRIRTACRDDRMMSGIIEADEMYVGGTDKNRHDWKKRNPGSGRTDKSIVFGMKSPGGRTKMVVIKKADYLTLTGELCKFVHPSSIIYTDESRNYCYLKNFFMNHHTVNHSAGQYVNRGVTTNGIEGVWAVAKRGIYGVYHHTSVKHLPRYMDEFAFRLNEGSVNNHTLERIDSLVSMGIGKRITYEELIG